MGGIQPEWLLHGSINASGLARDERPAVRLRARIASMYGGTPFSVRDWPQRGFRHTLWWSEKSVLHRYGAGYMLRTDFKRSATLYAGINVEKGYEDKDTARRKARERGEPLGQFLMDRTWDWHRAVSSLVSCGPAIQHAAGELGGHVYCWIEFSPGGDEQHLLVKPDAIYERGKYRPTDWNDVLGFVAKPRPQKWGRLALMRPFTVTECTPRLDDDEVLRVFETLRPVRDIWRGMVSPGAPPARLRSRRQGSV